MQTRRFPALAALCGLGLAVGLHGAALPPVTSLPAVALEGTQLLVEEGDLPERVLTGIEAFFRRETERSPEARTQFWARDLTSASAYARSIAPNRARLRHMIGAVDQRLPAGPPEYVATLVSPALVGDTPQYTVSRVRWPVFEGVQGEGLLIQPRRRPVARVVVLPDADETPEMLLRSSHPAGSGGGALVQRLADAGCQVVIPALVDRADTWSGNAALNRFTNQPHREWIYRQAYQMGRHIIGYEVQQVQAVLDWFEQENAALPAQERGAPPLGVAGYGEGGLVALYTAAVDERVEAVLVSGYFRSRQGLADEPVYRNLFGLLREFGDAEIATLVAPRILIIEPSAPPAVAGPPARRQGRSGAAPGGIRAAEAGEIAAEFNRAQRLLGPGLATAVRLAPEPGAGEPALGSGPARREFFQALRMEDDAVRPDGAGPSIRVEPAYEQERQRRLVRQLESFTQALLVPTDTDRAEFFWNKLERAVQEARDEAPPHVWERGVREYKHHFWDEIIGRLPPSSIPLNARTRLFRDEPLWRGYVVVLDVLPGVVTWGYLLVPRNIQPGERRPAVVCQHGVSGTPDATLDPESRAYRAYAIKLVEQGFVVFSHYNPNGARGFDRWWFLQRLANPLKQSIFSVIVAQHDRVLDFLSASPWVDPRRIGFYGLSYGGKTAVRVPALLDRYAVSICSGDFNEWIRKTTTVHAVTSAAAPGYRFSSYMFTGEYEILEFNLARTFNYAEMAALIAPRPFMVERGHFDRVGSDEWVAYEYAKVRRLYNATLKLPERTAIEYFDGGHEIHARGAFEFLQQHLQWPQ
jgi:dienelactone hydrolase